MFGSPFCPSVGAVSAFSTSTLHLFFVRRAVKLIHFTTAARPRDEVAQKSPAPGVRCSAPAPIPARPFHLSRRARESDCRSRAVADSSLAGTAHENLPRQPPDRPQPHAPGHARAWRVKPSIRSGARKGWLRIDRALLHRLCGRGQASINHIPRSSRWPSWLRRGSCIGSQPSPAGLCVPERHAGWFLPRP